MNDSDPLALLVRDAAEALAAPARPAAAAAAFALGVRRRRRRRLARAASAAAVLCVAAVGSILWSQAADRPQLLTAAPPVSPPLGQTFDYPPGRDRPEPAAGPVVPAPPNGVVQQVVPVYDGLRLGVYTSGDGQLCTAELVRQGNGRLSCPPELQPGWSGIYTSKILSPVEVIYGFAPASTAALFHRPAGADRGTAVTLYRGAGDFGHLVFYLVPSTTGGGPDTVESYDERGALVHTKAVGRTS